MRNDRLGRECGGVCAYIREEIKAKLVDSSPGNYDGKPEHMILEIGGSAHMPSVLIGIIYRAPRLQLPNGFWRTWARIAPFHSHSIIMGDLNINLLNENTTDSRHLRAEADNINSIILPFGPTHHTSSSHSWIDHILISKQSKINSYSQVPASLSGHDLLMADIIIDNPRPGPRKFSFRDFSGFDINSYLLDLTRCNWDDFLKSDSIDFKVDFFNQSITDTLNSHTQIKTVTFKKKNAPWLTTEIRALMLERDLWTGRSRRSGDQSLRLKFKSLRNDVKRLSAAAKAAYYINLFKKPLPSRKVWQNVKSLGIGKQRASSNGDLVVELEDLGRFFGKWGETRLTDPELDYPMTDPDSLHDNVSPPEKPNNSGPFMRQGQFDIPLISLNDLSRMVLAPGSNATGPDLISRRIIGLSLPVCGRFILHLFNFSILNNIYPEKWKLAFIRPIPKIPKPTVCSDYRPIALTCYLSKILEKIVAVRMIRFLELNRKFNPFQFSFRVGLSTQTALLNIMDDVRSAADRGELTVLVLFDFSKAFDTIEHRLLLAKLGNLGFSDSTCSWIASYLSNRRQCVLGDSGERSSWVKMTRGVPQGTIFGPLFFVCFSGDLTDSLLNSKYALFADDAQILAHCSPKDLASTIDKVNNDVQSIVNWTRENFMQLNPAKTQAMIIGTPRLVKMLDLSTVPKIRVGDREVEYSLSLKNLGVWLSHDLSWSRQISNVRSKVFYSLRQLRSAGGCLSFSMRKSLTKALISPHLDYCSILLLGAPNFIDDNLKKLMNCAIRFVFNTRNVESMSLLYVKLNWLTPHYQRLYYLGKLIFYILGYHPSHYLARRLMYLSDSSDRPRRISQLDLVVKFVNTDLGSGAFEVAGAKFWNSIPDQIRRSSSISVFGSNLHKFLLQKQKETILASYR